MFTPRPLMATFIDVCSWGFLISILFTTTLLAKFFIDKHLNLNTSICKKISHPPSPPTLPFIGHIHLLSNVLHKSLQTLASQYGPLMKISIGASQFLVVSDANVAREIFKTQDLNFVYRPKFAGTEFNMYTSEGFFVADYGPYWRFIKKTCMSKLLSVHQLVRTADIRHEEVMKLMESIVKCSERGEACDLGAEFMTIANNIICRMTMSTRCSGTSNEALQIREFTYGITAIGSKLAMGEMLGPLTKFDLFGYGKRLKALIKQFDELMETVMWEHEKKRSKGEKERKDMMDILLDIYKDSESEMKLTRNNIKAFFLEVFLAGTDTTSKALSWILAELISNPNVFLKLREEINSVVGPNRLVEEEDFPNLPYLQGVIKESLRLHPSLSLAMRRAKEDCKINGYDVLKDTRMMINIYAIMRDPTSWDRPIEFLPERFLEDQNNKDRNVGNLLGLDHRFMPFGNGRRSCPGASLAWNVMQLVTASLVQCFDWKVKDGETVNMEEGRGVTLAHPLLCYPVVHMNPLIFRS